MTEWAAGWLTWTGPNLPTGAAATGTINMWPYSAMLLFCGAYTYPKHPSLSQRNGRIEAPVIPPVNASVHPADHEPCFKRFIRFISVSDVSVGFETCFIRVLCVSLVVILTLVSLNRFFMHFTETFLKHELWNSFETFQKRFNYISFLCILRFKNTICKRLSLLFQMRFNEALCRVF